jgi:hypothetical protein
VGSNSYDLEIRVHYDFQQGRAETATCPAEPDMCVINFIDVSDGLGWAEVYLPPHVYEDRHLLDLCMLDYEEMCARNEEDRADSIREERILDRGQ